MRRHRRALVLSLVAAFVAALLISGFAQAGPGRSHEWKLSANHATQRRTSSENLRAVLPLATATAATAASTTTTTTTAPAPGPSSPAVTITAPPVGFAGSHADYALDATTTDTPDWACIRKYESGDTYTDYSGAYGFEGGDFSGMSPADQDALALSIFQRNGDRFGPYAWSTHTACGLE